MPIIAGIQTSYDERLMFANKLQELFEKIEELNRPTPMNENEFLIFANILKDLNSLSTNFKQNTTVVQVLRTATRQPRPVPPPIENLASNPNYFFCERCDTHQQKKHKARHQRSARCVTTCNTKSIAGRLSKIDNNHPFYEVGQILMRHFRNRPPYFKIGVNNIMRADYIETYHTFRQFQLPTEPEEPEEEEEEEEEPVTPIEETPVYTVNVKTDLEEGLCWRTVEVNGESDFDYETGEKVFDKMVKKMLKKGKLLGVELIKNEGREDYQVLKRYPIFVPKTN